MFDLSVSCVPRPCLYMLGSSSQPKHFACVNLAYTRCMRTLEPITPDHHVSLRNISHVLRRFKNVLGATILNRTELSRSHQNVYVRCFVTSIDDAEVQHTELCIKDISLLCSNEDNPQFTDPVRIIATTNFQLNCL